MTMRGMDGKHVIVTGPTSGLGERIALDLGAGGAHVILACRNMERGRAVAAEIARLGGPRAEVLYFDASSRAAIADFAAAYRAVRPRLDVLVNNAGVSYSARTETVDGVEMTFGTNVLGYQALTLALLDLLVASAPSRVVTVASSFAGHLDLDDLQFLKRPYDGLSAYAQSKACNRLLTWALARRLDGRGVTANAMAPGFVPATGLPRHLSPELQRAYATRTGRSVAQGADTAVWLASNGDVEGVTGAFFYDRKSVPCEFGNLEQEERLWRICGDLLGNPPEI
jgi:NAD(P)-dependent dehydrogenase (short-subunit alcohol dehydrogenase family)